MEEISRDPDLVRVVDFLGKDVDGNPDDKQWMEKKAVKMGSVLLQALGGASGINEQVVKSVLEC